MAVLTALRLTNGRSWALPGPDGFYLDCGFSGTGFKIGPAVGLCMAELIVDGRAQTVDITPFDVVPFLEGKKLIGKHAYEDIWR